MWRIIWREEEWRSVFWWLREEGAGRTRRCGGGRGLGVEDLVAVRRNRRRRRWRWSRSIFF
jgi:hypothetical protein